MYTIPEKCTSPICKDLRRNGPGTPPNPWRRSSLPRYLFSLVLGLALLVTALPASAAQYRLQKLTDNIYAAITVPGGKASSNALLLIEEREVILAGAHFIPEAIQELVREAAKLTPLPVGTVILTHHHAGFNYVDFDLPKGAKVIMTGQTWQALRSETRPFSNDVLFFDSAVTLQRGKQTIILTNMERGQSDGDLVVYVANERLLFASDMVYAQTVGYMGGGYMREWVAGLGLLLDLEPKIVVPGLGNVTDRDGMNQFRLFLKDFLTEILLHLEKGQSLAETKRTFRLPKHEQLPGYKTFFDVNLSRAYQQLKELR